MAAPAWTPPRCRCFPAARPNAPGCAPATPTAAGTSARATTASARTTRASRCARSPGRWRPPSPPPPGRPARRPRFPNLAIGLAMARPGEDPGGTGARVLASAAARGHKPGWLGYDRAYTAALPGRFHLPARALGYSPVMDYRTDQLGIQANTGGAILVEGTWYCPALPGPLITATTRLRGHAITRELYDQQITARACYRLKRKDGPDADGYQRLSCPATGSHPGLICPLRQTSLTARRAAQGPPAPARTPQALPADRDHHRPGHRRPLPPGPALRQPRLARPLRHLAEHHRRPQRLRQRPRPPGPRPARPPPRPRHRRPVDLHRTAADRRQHPQDPRLAGAHRQRQSPHHPPGTAAPSQPDATTSPTADRRSTPSATGHLHPAGQAAHASSSAGNSATPPAPATSSHGDQRHCQTPARILKNRPPPAVLSVRHRQFCR